MKKAFAFLLCIALCLYFIPLPLSAEGSIQYKAIIEIGPDSYEIEPAESVSDAVYNDQCAGVVVYSLDAGDEPPEISNSFDGFYVNTVIFSNVSFDGHIACNELYLLGNAKVITSDGKMVITGTSASADGEPGEPKDALTEDVLGSYISLRNALDGAENKYTITESLDINYPLHVYDLKIQKGATLKIKPSEEGNVNDIIVSHSLKVDGNLTAEEGQVLEIKAGCKIESASEDFKLYDSDGNNEFTFTGENTEIFDYSADTERWVRRPGGGGPGGPGGGDDPQPTYTVTVTYSGDGQVEAQDGYTGESDGFTTIYTITHGEKIRFRFSPGNGHKISKILADDHEAELRNEYEFNNVTANHTLFVEFGKKGNGSMHTITVTANENGTVAADGLGDNGNVLVEDMFDHTFTFTPDPGYHIKYVIAAGEGFEMDMTYYGVRYDEETSAFTLTLKEISQDMTLGILFALDNADDITFKKYVVTRDNNTAEKIAEVLAKEFSFIGYIVNPASITVKNIDPSGIDIDLEGYGTFDFSVTVGGTLIEDQGYIVQDYDYIIFEFEGFDGEKVVDEIRVLTPDDIKKMEFSAPAMDSGSMKIYGANGIRLEGITSSDVIDAFIDGTRNEAVIGRAFYRAEWHIANSIDMFEDQSLNLFGLNIIQDDAFCVQVAASGGDGVQREQRTYNWDLNRYAQLTTGNYTSYVFFGNDIFTLRSPENGIGGVNSLEIETGDFPGYTITKDAENQYTLTFLSDFYDNITLDLLINSEIEQNLTIRRVGVDIQEIEKKSDSNYGNVSHGTQNGTHITFNGQNNYQIFAVYYIPDFVNTAPYGLYVTYTWADGSTTTEIITEPTGVFLDDVNDNFVSCCDYQLYSAPNKNAAPVSVNVIVLRDNPLDADSFGGVYFGSGKGVEWPSEDE